MTFSIICSRSSHLFMVLSVSIHRYVEPFVISCLYGFPVMIRSHYDDSVHAHHFRTVILTLMHSYYPVCLTWNVITMSCSSTCYPHRPQFLFSFTYCTYDAVLSDELVYKFLHCRYVGAAFLISMDIVIFLRCWTMISCYHADSNYYYCRLWTTLTEFVNYADVFWTMSQ